MNQAKSLGTRVPTRGLVGAALVALAALVLATGTVAEVQAAESKPTISGVVNVNTASREELQLLPGVGEVRAVAIVEKRKERGGFKTVEELLEVKGIGIAMLDRMRPHLTLTGKTTAERL